MRNVSPGESAFPVVGDNHGFPGNRADESKTGASKERSSERKTEPKKKSRPKTDEEYAGVVASLTRALGRRVAWRDPEDFAALFKIADDAMAEAKLTAMKGIRENSAASWDDVARATGMSRQAARQYWTKRGVK